MESNTRAAHPRQSRKNHAKNKVASLQVTSATWVKDHQVCVEFNDGTERVVDFGPWLTDHATSLTDPYRNLEKFKSFHIEKGHLVWGEDWDMVFPIWKLHRGFLDA